LFGHRKKDERGAIMPGSLRLGKADSCWFGDDPCGMAAYSFPAAKLERDLASFCCSGC
jgi:hypothetical protein